MHFKLILTFAILRNSIISGNYTCFSCVDVTSPHDCNHIARCGPSEKCYVDSHVDTLGFIRYDLGCRDDYMCTASAMVGKRRGTTPVCRECCSGDLCNDKGCGVASLNTPGILCYGCDMQGRVDGCSKVSRCGSNEVCSLGLHLVSTTGQMMYYSACEKQDKCPNANESTHICTELTDMVFADGFLEAMNPCGKEITSGILACRSSQHAQGQNARCPIQCCGTSLCNNQCGTSTSGGQTTRNPHVITNSPVSMTSLPLDPCLSNPCVSGTCSMYSNTYKCTCNNGYHGRNCDIPSSTDHCLSNPCVHGTCNSGQTGYSCTCRSGFVGKNCDAPIDHCLSNPCIHGTCSNGQSGYSCACSRGYTGKICDNVIDHCNSSPCVQGTCTSGLSGYTCECNRGYTGRNCDVAVNHCSPDPCGHGSCKNGQNGYTCNCYTGYTGTLCNRVIDHCSSNPCVHGTCTNHGSGYTCSCNNGYSGNRCDQVLDHCTYDPCDLGDCVNGKNGFTCNCWRGYTGTLCDTVLDHCTSDPCDYGNCVNGRNGFTCNCWQGYTGTLCDKVGCPPIDNRHCQPGALCTVFENGCRICKPECRIG